jgi:hypothetical protein
MPPCAVPFRSRLLKADGCAIAPDSINLGPSGLSFVCESRSWPEGMPANSQVGDNRNASRELGCEGNAEINALDSRSRVETATPQPAQQRTEI